MMKIIDWERKGNVIRLYLGDKDLKSWYGDDWDGSPYELNAGKVYDEFIVGHRDYYIPFEYEVYECCDQGLEVSKNDLRNREYPILLIVPPENSGYETIRVYMGDPENIFCISGDEVFLNPFNDRKEL